MPTAATENAGLGPCDLQDPLWVKMSAAVSGGVNKKRKKTDTKPHAQAQINKCRNEKRRREQENIYIEELAELISASFADMSSLSVKPDKCAILKETVHQIQHIKQQEGTSSDAVQQGEVSSSKPTILANEVFGPLLLEALEGFLFVVNTEGKVEYVTENVCQFIKYTKEDVLGQSIYNIIHLGDHARFSATLLPITIGWNPDPSTRSRSFSCRFLIKPPDSQDETMEERQQRVSKYETMQISSTLLPYPSDKAEGGDVTSESVEAIPCLMCVARRIPENEKQNRVPFEQFTTKLDTSGKIIGVDTSGVSSTYSQYLNKDLMGCIIQELCHQHDLQKLTNHLKEAVNTGHSTSAPYRLRVTAPDKYVHVQTKSKLFKSNGTIPQEPDFIMATHSIIGPLQEQGPSSGFSLDESKDSKDGIADVGNSVNVGEGSSNTRLRNLLTNKRPSTGGEEGSEPMDHTGLGDGSDAQNENRILKGLLNQDDKDDARGDESTVMRSSPGSRHVGARSTSSSDTPKVSSNSNNMLLKLLNEKSDDDDLEHQKQNELLQQLLKKQDEERKPLPMSMDTGQQQQTEDPLLKSLGFPNPTPSPPSNTDPMTALTVSSIIGTRKRPSDEGDDGGGVPTTKRTLDGLLLSGPQVNSPGPSATSSGGKSKLWEKNQMLASLLAKQPSKPTTIPPIPASIISAVPQEKLPRVVDPAKVRSGGWSAGGLQPPSTTQSNTRPSVQQQVPGRRQPGPNFALNHTEQQQQQQQQHQLQQQVLLQQKQQPSPQQQRGHTHQQEALFVTPVTTCTSGDFRTAGHVGAADSCSWENQSSDPVLSELLDQVIDIVPESIITADHATLLNILDVMEPSPNNTSSFQHDINERMAISAIQKSLMQCETVVKSPSSPTISLPGTPPAYTSTTMSQSGGYPPPPMYPQRPRLNIQQAAGQLGVRPAGNMPYSNSQVNNQITVDLQQYKQRYMLQQHQKRLLQAQQQQQLVIPSSATTVVEQLTPGLQNIDSLLNNTVAPNVSLQRSSSVPDSQLSPNYGGQMLNSGGAQISPGQRQPYSPHSQLPSPLSQSQSQTQQQVAQQQQQQGFPPVGSGLNSFTNNQQGAQSRLSPHPPGGLPPFQQSQLSPRMSQGQQGYPALSNSLTQSSQAASNWSQARLSLQQQQQQQNSMLNAQLTGSYGGGGGRQFTTQRGQQAPPQQQLPPVRSLPSPGTPGGPRQSSYPQESFPPPASPTAGNYQAAGQFSQQLRLQRTISAPSATTQLPGGVNSPRPYGLKQDPQHLLSPGHPMSPHPFHPPEPHPLQPHHHTQHHTMMYHVPAPDSQFCFNQADIHMYGANDRGRPQAHTPTNHQPGGGNSGISSEFVRQELRAVVGARTQQQSGGGGSQGQGARQQQQQLQLGQQVSPTDLDSLGSLAFEIPTSGASDSKQLWGNIGSGSPQPGLSSSRNTMEESPRPGEKASLLQKLLSE